MQPETVVDYTGDAERLVAGIEKMGQRAGGQPSGAQLLEAINENLEGLAQPGKRPVMVVMRLGGAATSQIRPEVVRETIRKAGIQLFALSPPNAGGGGGGMPTSAGGERSDGTGATRLRGVRIDLPRPQSRERAQRRLETIRRTAHLLQWADDHEGNRPAHAGAAEPVSDHLYASCRHEAQRPYFRWRRNAEAPRCWRRSESRTRVWLCAARTLGVHDTPSTATDSPP